MRRRQALAAAVLPAGPWAQAGSAAGHPELARGAPFAMGMSSPVGLALDAGGHLFVANWSGGTVVRIRPDGQVQPFAEQLNGPAGLAVAPDGDIVVASYHDDLVWRFTPRGRRSVFARGLTTPAGLVFDRGGRLLVANRRSNQVVAVSEQGRVSIAVDQGLDTPVGVVPLQDGSLAISNFAAGVAWVSPGGRSARTVSRDFRHPAVGIVSLDGASVLVADYGGTQVKRVDAEGCVQVVAEGLGAPVGLAAGPSGSVFVADWATHAVYRFPVPPPAQAGAERVAKC